MGDVMSDQSDRRAATRQPVYLGVELVTRDRAGSSAITKNASDGGLLLLARTHLKLEERVELRVLEAGTSRVLGSFAGRVVRRQELTAEEACVWTDKVAVALDEPFGDIYQHLAELGEQQAKVYDMS